jgi:hypothetical protein
MPTRVVPTPTPTVTAPPAGTTSGKSDAKTAAVVTGSLILSAVLFAAIGWGVERALDKAFKKRT